MKKYMEEFYEEIDDNRDGYLYKDTIYFQSKKFGWKMLLSVFFVDDPKDERFGEFGITMKYKSSLNKHEIKDTFYCKKIDDAIDEKTHQKMYERICQRVKDYENGTK